MPTVHECFELQTARAPERVAVVCGERQVSYGALDARGNRLARHLIAEHAVKPEMLVAVVLDRSDHYLTGILGILKAGGAFVPIEPAQPDSRIAFVLEDTAATVVLTDAANEARIRQIVSDPALSAVAVVVVDGTEMADVLERGDAGKPDVTSQPEHLAYVIYTSGTTGTPNGVLIEHGAVVNYVANARDHLGLSPAHVCDFSTSIGFDLTITTTLACLCVGGCVAVYPDSVLDLAQYRAHLVDRHVTFVKLTPSYFALLAGSIGETDVATLVLGGEKLGRDVLEQINERQGRPVEVFDEYGPTETTVGACFSKVYPLPTGGLDIGVFYDRCFGYVLDSERREVETGATGELYVGGAGLARGYLNRPELTAERFIDHVVLASAIRSEERRASLGGRLYRTGDVVRRRPDGRLEYVGRDDEQVKVRGYRIEPGEIEAVLKSNGDVAQAAVTAHRSGRSHTIVAYVVPGEFGCSREELSAFLEPLLPEHMRPTAYVFLDALPLTVNGKLDRAALPRPPAAPSERFVAPRTELERTVRAVWASLLNVDESEIGINDEFLALGGDSIVAIQLLSRLRQTLNGKISVQELFAHNTIQKLCTHLSSTEQTDERPPRESETGPLSGDVRLLPIQQWFFSNRFRVPDHWNQAFVIRTPELDVDRLQAAVADLNRSHGAFQLRFRTSADGVMTQCYDPDARPVRLRVLDIRDLSSPYGTAAFSEALQDQLTRWQAHFDLQTGPLHSIGYVHGFPDGSARIHVAAHHLVIDAVSWRIVAEDLHRLYMGLYAGLYAGAPMSPPTSSFRQWTDAVARYPAARPAEERFWRELLDRFARDGDAAVAALVAGETTATRSHFELSEADTNRLLRDCHAAFNTQVNDVLLAAFAMAMREVTGQSALHIILEGHGREDVEASLDVTRTVGWFTTMFPVCLEVENDPLATLAGVKECLRTVPNKGIGYGAFFGYDNEALPRINFNYLGQFVAADRGDAGIPSWEIVPEDAGEAVHAANRDPNVMTINGLVVDGRLRFTIVSKFDPDTAAVCTSEFQHALERLIAQTTALDRRVLTPSDVDHVISKPLLDELQQKHEIESVYRANSLQQGFIYHAVTEGPDDAYVVQMRWTYHCAIDPDRLERAWRRAQQTFPSLRLRFDWREELVQIVDRRPQLDWHVVDLSDAAAGAQEEAIRKLEADDRARGFDLASGPLFRLYLVKRSARRFGFLFSSHHAILDGWSNTLLLDFVHEEYSRPSTGEHLPDTGYLRAQGYLADHHADDLDFWSQQAERIEERPNLQGLMNAAARREGIHLSDYRRVRDVSEAAFHVNGTQYADLRRFAKTCGVTLNALLLYTWHKALHVFGGASQTTTGVVVSGRTLPIDGIHGAVGLLINTLPSLVEHDDDERVATALQTIQRSINEMNERCCVDLTALSRGGKRLFDTLFIYENWPGIDPRGWKEELDVSFDGQVEKLDYPLAVVASETDAELIVRLTYAGELLDARCVEEVQLLVETVLGQLSSVPRWADMELMPPAEAALRVAHLRSPQVDRTRDGVFHELFERQAERTPDRVSVRCGDASLTYDELNARSSRLAAVLITDCRLQREEPVVLCLDRTLDVFVAMLAVMKAGGAYVPVDPTYPVERLHYIVDDTAARVVITQGAHRRKFEGMRFERTRFDGTMLEGTTLAATGHDGMRPDGPALLDLNDAALRRTLASDDVPARGRVRVESANLANIIYTSGTTGQPKGVMIEHGSFCLIADAVRARFFADRDRVSTYSLTNFVFDVFGLEYALPFLTGGTIDLGVDLPETLSCRNFDFIQLTPSVLELMLEGLTDIEDTLLLCGGEPLSGELLRRVMARSIDLVNVYGPTESTIWSTARRYRHAAPSPNPWIDLGLPFANERIFILDATLRPVPAGATGELYVGGDGLARGYLNRADLTAERFLEEPFGPGTERIYRTGDLVRLHPNGEIEFVGRNDFQVKIRGHRIELGEIEAVIAAFPGVRHCVVVVRDTALVGYYVAAGDVEAVALTSHVQRMLPEYMVPAALVRVDAMPLTPSGKIDRTTLPVPVAAAASGQTPPRSDRERGVRAVWARCLGLADEKVGIDDDFFWLGGDSIQSIRLCAELRRTMEVDASVSYLNEHRTIRRFVDGLGVTDDDYGEIAPCAPARVEDQLLSFAQERLWFVEDLSRGSAAYNVSLVLRVSDRVDLGLLGRSIVDLLERHETLRTVFREADDGSIYQLVENAAAGVLDLEATPVADMAALYTFLKREVHRPFELTREQPFRARLYRVEDSDERYLSIVVHHVAFDGWSIDVLLRDLLAFYRAQEQRASGVQAGVDLPELPIRYRDYALWERAFLTPGRLSAQVDFWRRYLADFETLRLPTDFQRPDVPDYRGDSYRFQLDAGMSSDLRQLARELRVSLFSVLLSAYYLALRCFCYQDDVIVGAPVANRSHSQIENLVGVFVNSLPLRTRIDTQTLVCDFIRQTGADCAAVLRYQHLPFEKLVDAMDVVQDRSRHPIYQVLFDVQTFGRDFRDPEAPLSLAGKAWELSTVAKHDLSIFVDDAPDGLDVFVNYATSLFREDTVVSFAETYAELLRQIAALTHDAPARWYRKLAHLDYLSAERRRRIVEDINPPAPRCESSATICELFEDQAAAHGDRTAVVAGEARLTYHELNRRANRLAHHLRGAYGVGKGVRVLLCLERSEHMIVAILAALKAGGAYVPVEPAYPDRRIDFILKDSRPGIVLTDEIHVERFQKVVEGIGPAGDGAPSSIYPPVVAIDAPAFDERLALEPIENPTADTTCASPAYVIYTSGSTGTPKGVLEVHENVVRLFEATNPICEIGGSDVWPLFHSYVFDFSVWEIWGALLHGGQLVIPSHDEVRDPRRFYDLCARWGVTILNQTPAALQAFMDVALDENAPPLSALRLLFVGGEQWNVDILVPWFRRFGDEHPRIVHVYGPTEATVFATMQPFTFPEGKVDSSIGNVDPSIGPVLPNMTAYVVDPELRTVPVGAIGELCIGGTGIAAGYLNQDRLTAGRFIPNPFQSDADRSDTRESPLGRNARLYRSGDLVRMREDGRLTFVGRNDFQVKVQGHRIELGEIEAVMAQYPGISRCVAAVRRHSGGKDGDPYLAAYYVARGIVDEQALREHLAGSLPSYMLPSALVALDRMPLTVSGKIDRHALPDPETAHADAFAEPRTLQEWRVRQIVAEILALEEEKISVKSDFFGLGGNSLKSIRLVVRLNREFGAGIGIATLFRSPSIAGLARELQGREGAEEPIPRYRPDDPMEQVLSYSQERLWFVDQYEGGTSAYNIGLAFELVDDVDLEALDRSLRALYARHEVLRTLVRYGDAGGYQLVLDAESHPLHIRRRIVADERQLAEALTHDVEAVIDLAHDVPFRAHLYLVERATHLGFFIHHIAFDGWSVEVMLSELEALYRCYSSASISRPDVPELPIQYRDFAAWERSRLSGDAAARAIRYWTGRLKNHPPLNLPTDRPRPPTVSYRGDEVAFDVSETTTAALRMLAAELKVSLFSVLLSAYCALLRAYAHQDDVIVGVPIANRAHGQVEPLIGCFLNTLALDVHVDGGDRIVELIRNVSARIIEGRQHQDLPFERLVAELDLAVDPSRHPVFQVTFDVNSFVRSHFAGNAGRAGALLRSGRPEIGSAYSAKFDFSAFIDDSGDRLQGTFTYATSLFDRTTVEGFTETFSLLLEQFGRLAGRSGSASERVSDLALLTDEAFQQIVHGWGEGERIPRAGTTVLDLFEGQVHLVPFRTAVVFEGRSLTYRELNEEASRLAGVLRAADVGLEDLVVLCLERSERMIAAILAVWKAGGAYVPVDPDFPDGRLAFILDDTAAKVVLCDEKLRGRLERVADGRPAHIVAIDGLEGRAPGAPLGPRPASEHLAYVMYTSGTSGEPKGVCIEHGSLANLQADQTVRYGIGEGGLDEVILQVSNYIFDASVEQFILALPNGHTLLLVPDRLWVEGERFRAYLRRNHVTHVSATPTFLNRFDVGPLPDLRRYVVGGEALDAACYGKLIDANDVDVFNQYGPTEITVCATGQCIRDGDISIGGPMANVKLFVLSADRMPVPSGAVGELYICGLGVARGYLNKPELTMESFLRNPFQSVEEQQDRSFGPEGRYARAYRTGDLVRWRRDGRLEYVGRVDQQVKIRGYRVELSEISAVLSACPGVTRSVVTQTVNEQLAAYYSADAAVDEDEVVRILRHTLPDYMVPAFLTCVDEIPMTAHGKLDLNLLPPPRLSRTAHVAAPRDPLESRLRKEWSDVLGVREEDLGIDDDFFRVGGNSILALRLITRVNAAGKGELSIVDLFAHRTIREQSAALRRSEYRGIMPLNRSARKPCLFMIHPAHAGSEVYASLARRLEGRFHCIGIDSYNLRNAVKIDSLHELAAYYLDEIDPVLKSRDERTLRLLGWSLGGHIALEMAAILESRGLRDIALCLLDTVVPDERLAALTAGVSVDEQAASYRERMVRAGYEDGYVDTVLANFRTDAALSTHPVSGRLRWSKVLLFKGLSRDGKAGGLESVLHEHVAPLHFNNIDLVHQDPTRLSRIDLPNAHHYDVLDYEDEIVAAIGSWPLEMTASTPAAKPI